MWSRLYAHVIHAVTQDPVFQRVPGFVRWSAIVIFNFLLILNEGSDISSYTDAERSHRTPKTNALRAGPILGLILRQRAGREEGKRRGGGGFRSLWWCHLQCWLHSGCSSEDVSQAAQATQPAAFQKQNLWWYIGIVSWTAVCTRRVFQMIIT